MGQKATTTETPVIMTVYIEFLNKDKGFTRDRKEFENYETAVNWGKSNLDNFNLDMIQFTK